MTIRVIHGIGIGWYGNYLGNVFNSIEYVAVLFISLFNSPKRSMKIVQRKIQAYKASKRMNI